MHVIIDIMYYERILDLRTALKQKSCFLFGPRATGKSLLIKKKLPEAIIFDLLDSDVYGRFLRRPRQLGEEVKNHELVVIDEIQKIPAILDEVHRLIENEGKKFLLTGSSARKVKRGGANLLAGRARSREFFPLVSAEITDFDLIKYVNYGGLPLVYLSDTPAEDLADYANTYLKEEIQAEALVRRIDHFAKFMDVIGLTSGKELNLAGVASDSGVPPRTVAAFIEVLKDTLLAFELEPFAKTKKRKFSARTKLYMFDVGVANHLAARKQLVPKNEQFGDAFEHFIIQEVRALLSLRGIDEKLFYWRSNGHEVDLIVGNRLAVEIKSSENISERHLKGLLAFKEEGLCAEYAIVSRDPVDRQIGAVNAYYYKTFLKKILEG